MSFYADEMVELRHSDYLNPATGLACLSDSSIDVRITDHCAATPSVPGKHRQTNRASFARTVPCRTLLLLVQSVCG